MRRYISILIVAISIAATSCNNFLVKEESTPPEGAFVTLAVGKTGSRTILPESYDEVSTLKDFVFTATSEDHEPITQTFADYDSLQTAKVPIVAGTWDFSLSATSQHGVQYKGALDNKIIVVGSNNLSFDIQITELSAEPGALEVQLTFPGTNVAVVKAGLYSIAGEALSGFSEEVLAITSGNTVTYNKDTVPGGSHLIQFSFYGDAECRMFLGMHTESVVIVSGKKSAATRSIESINQMYTITYELDGGSFVEGYTAPEKFTSGMEFQLPKVSKVRKSGMSFFGWYTDAAFTGSPVYSLPRGTCESKVYYAKWGTFTAETIDAIDLGSVAGDYDLVVSGPVTSETISTLQRKLTFAGTSAKIHLNLSQTTGLTSIGNGAFMRCSELTSVEIPAGVTSIGNGAFGGCSGLTSVTFGEGSQLESIGSSAFEGSSELTSVEIPASVTSIGHAAFMYCMRLTSVTFGVGCQLENIDSSTFSYCRELTRIEIPDGVTSIGDFAFSGCNGLTHVEIPSSVTSIGSAAFAADTGSTSVYYQGDLSSWCEMRRENDGLLDYCENLYINGKLVQGELLIPDGVARIHDYAFDGFTMLTSVKIPASVTDIGTCAFRSCSGLTSVEISSSVTSIGSAAFGDCSGLTSVEIPSSVTSIGSSAFYGCSGLTSVEIPVGVESFGSFPAVTGECRVVFTGEIDEINSTPFNFSEAGESTKIYLDLSHITGLTSIGEYVFENCSGLTSVKLPSSVASIGEGAFSGCSGLTSVEIPSSVTSIGESAFSGCSWLTSVELPSSVTSIGDFAFSGCSIINLYYQGDLTRWCEVFERKTDLLCKNLYINGELVRDLVIPDGITSIGTYVFSGCYGLTSVEIPSSVTSIGDFAFSGCSGLTSVEIPSSVTSIGTYAFSGCSGLTSVEIPAGVTSIGDSAFRGCSGLTSVEIPAGVTSIGRDAFWSCSGLTSVEIPASVTSIGRDAFWSCSGLTSVEIPASVTSIGSSAFYECSGLTSVEIPPSVTSIGEGAFYGCSGLTSVTFGDTSGWYVTKSSTNWSNKTGGTAVTLSSMDLAANARLVKTTYDYYYWYKVD